MKLEQLTSVLDFQGGSQPPKKDFESQPSKSNIRFLQIRDFKTDEKIVYIPISKKNRLCKKDDILIARYGASVGQILSGKEGAYNVALMKVIDKNELYKTRYLYYFFNSPYFQKNLLSRSERSAQAGFNKGDLSEIKIPVPSLQEQEKIVERLDEAEKISTELFEIYKKQLFDLKILYDGFLIGLFSSLNKNITPLQLSTINITDGSHNPAKGIDESNYMMLSSKNVIDDNLNFENPRYLKKEDFILENKRTKLEVNDVLLTIVGTIGRTAVVKSLEHNITFQRSVCVIKPNKEILDPYYLKYFFDSIKSFLEKNARGVAQKGIYLKQIRAINIPLMDLHKQQQLVTKIEKVNNLVKEITSKKKEQILKQEQLKKSILNKEFSYE